MQIIMFHDGTLKCNIRLRKNCNCLRTSGIGVSSRKPRAHGTKGSRQSMRLQPTNSRSLAADLSQWFFYDHPTFLKS